MSSLPEALISRLIGQNIRMHRQRRGMSQAKLGEAVGVTFQQVQKYESGANRVSACTLYLIARVLNIPMQSFCEGLEVVGAAGADRVGVIERLLERPENMRAICALSEISDPIVRAMFLDWLARPRDFA